MSSRLIKLTATCFNTFFLPGGEFIRCLPIIALAFLLALAPSAPAGAQPSPAWRDTGALPAADHICFDVTRAGTLLVAYTSPGAPGPPGTYRYDLATGQSALLSEQPFNRCAETMGLLFFVAGESGTALRFSPADPTPRQIARVPTHFATDGSRRLYALADGLWLSEDGGLSWIERALPPGIAPGASLKLLVAPADSRALYLATGAPAAETRSVVEYRVYFSPDAGASWEPRLSDRFVGESNAAPELREIYAPGSRGGSAARLPADTLFISFHNGFGGRLQTRNIIFVSTDGGRSFVLAGASGAYYTSQHLYASGALLRLTVEPSAAALARSRDGGRSWEDLPLPFSRLPPEMVAGVMGPFIIQSPAAPAILLLSDGLGNLWQSQDAGQSWQTAGRAFTRMYIAPYLPAVAVSLDGGRLYALDLPDPGPSLTAPAPPLGGGSLYFPETGHSIAPVFRSYWERNGGLARFGYPRTDPFLEANPADGGVYLVQYFERNRFEYHPENSGTPYEVLLGLLGNQFTAGRRAAGEAPFQPIADPVAPGVAFFPQTGHTLRGAFRAYWERNGGLAAYGYPISEEFTEVNAEDGRSYVIQYFERNRFEYHPENAGTPYEVLLGLLGNRLLRDQGRLE